MDLGLFGSIWVIEGHCIASSEGRPLATSSQGWPTKCTLVTAMQQCEGHWMAFPLQYSYECLNAIPNLLVTNKQTLEQAFVTSRARQWRLWSQCGRDAFGASAPLKTQYNRVISETIANNWIKIQFYD